ncbi:hypothetical protein RJT34_17274 [Clitoria ternatea]|uniref:Uncharacterized protein n=1 Tax=Clitoria ternatea TaxID=43366 RepID=A0AAN9J8N4_CLITE
MEFRSKSCRDENLQMGSYNGGGRVAPTSMQDLRCYSANYAAKYPSHNREVKMEKGKGRVSNSSKASMKSWSFHDPELQRKKRVAGYKIYAVEGKMKGSLRKSLRWIKNTCTQAVHGWW